MSTLEMVRLINQEDHKVTDAVGREAQHIARAVDIITGHMKQGGRLIYVGAGTSGRLGILDAVECPPTYSTEPELVQGLIAGGTPAIFRAVEGAEMTPTWAARIWKRSTTPNRMCWWASLPAAARPMSSALWSMPSPWAA